MYVCVTNGGLGSIAVDFGVYGIHGLTSDDLHIQISFLSTTFVCISTLCLSYKNNKDSYHQGIRESSKLVSTIY